MNSSLINKKVFSEDIKKSLIKINTKDDDEYQYDYADDYVLSDYIYIIREIEDEIYIERVTHTDEDEDEGFEKLQKIKCNDKFLFLETLNSFVKK